MSVLTDLTIAEARDGLRARRFSAEELTLAHLNGIEALNPRLNDYLYVMHSQAIEQARAAAKALAPACRVAACRGGTRARCCMVRARPVRWGARGQGV